MKSAHFHYSGTFYYHTNASSAARCLNPSVTLEMVLLSKKNVASVLYPGKGECADPVNEDAILEKEGGGEPQDRNGERQLASDTGGGKT
jgi:hypothetical protein